MYKDIVVFGLMRLDWRVENAKVQRMELLYAADGRQDRKHPRHGLYTALAVLAPSAQEAGSTALLTATASAEQAEQPMET
jgi:hypothetical protein